MRKSFVLISLLLPLSLFSQVGYIQEGNASFYGDEFEGRLTASGEKYSHLKATCAHVSIPFGSLVKITNLENNKTAIARVNDRGPFVPDRIIDVSKSVAKRLGMVNKGVVRVKIEVIDNQGMGLSPSKPKVHNPKKQKHTIKTPDATDGKSDLVVTNEKNPSILGVDVSKLDEKGYFIQIGSFKEQNNLFELLYDARNKTGKKTFIKSVQTHNERLFKVLVGPFNNRNDAEKIRQTILNEYPGCFIIKI